MDENKNEFELLKNQILKIALKYLKQTVQDKIPAFKEALKTSHNSQTEKTTFEGALIIEPYNKWRELFIDIVDVDLQICRLEDSLTLLDSSPPQEFPLGEWVDYHYSAWLILAQSLLSRVEKLVKDIVRDVIKPKNRAEYEKTMLKTISTFKSKIKPARDPIAHVRGAVDGIREQNVAESVIVAGGYKVRDLFQAEADNQGKWHAMLNGVAQQIILEIMNICEQLNKAVNWATA